MSHFGSALSRCGRLCIVFFYYYWLPGVLNYSYKDDRQHYGFGFNATTKIPSYRTSTLPPTRQSTTILTTISSREPKKVEPEESTPEPEPEMSTPEPETDNQSSMIIIIIPSSLVAFIILLTTIVGVILILKILKKRRKDKVASAVESDDQQQQPRVDYNNLIHSSHSIGLEPEVDYFYENVLTEPSAPNMKTIISPVYATVEFLPRCSVVEDYANTLRPEEFLNFVLPILYDDIAGE